MGCLRQYFSIRLKGIVALVFCLLSVHISAQIARFTVVLDAGHGGHDPGAQNGSAREKDINLSVTLLLGRLIEQNAKDVKVVYTRKSDVFLELQERADVVNNNHADLFICIHTNSSKGTSAFGTETYTLGLAKSKGNLDVAMRENSVMMLEKDYKAKYKGFDPKSVESYIMFEFMQDKYLDKSIEFASDIQGQFTNYCSRSDRGVRQAGFWVLWRSACPSVLVELGFVSNPAEMLYLTSERGQSELARAIFNAFLNFKRKHDRRSGKPVEDSSLVVVKNQNKFNTNSTSEVIPSKDSMSTETKNQADNFDKEEELKGENRKNTSVKTKPNDLTVTDKPVYKIQLFASNRLHKGNSELFKGLEPVDHYLEKGLYKYTYGNETDNLKIKEIRKSILSKFPDAFIVAFIGEKKISEQDAIKISK